MLYSNVLRLKMNFDDDLLFGSNSMSEVQDPFTSLSSEHVDVVELQPVATPHNGSLSEEEKNNVRNLLDDWNMGFLFKTCLGEYKFIIFIITIINNKIIFYYNKRFFHFKVICVLYDFMYL